MIFATFLSFTRSVSSVSRRSSITSRLFHRKSRRRTDRSTRYEERREKSKAGQGMREHVNLSFACSPDCNSKRKRGKEHVLSCLSFLIFFILRFASAYNRWSESQITQRSSKHHFQTARDGIAIATAEISFVFFFISISLFS